MDRKRNRFRNVYCIDCGKFIWHAHGNRKRCAECRKAFNLIRASDYYKKNAERLRQYGRDYYRENLKAA